MYKFLFSNHFKKQLKPYTKKYPDFKEEFIENLKNIKSKNTISLGKNLYKIRMRFSCIPKGESKSFRLIVLIIKIENALVPLAFYFKGDRQSISKKEIILHKKIIEHELKL